MAQAVSEKGYKGLGMEGFTAKWYASVTLKSIEDFKQLARRVSGQLPPGSKVLEVAPGPGYFSVELAKLGKYSITGLDISHTFVDIARKNAADARVDVDFRQGNVAAMPFDDNSFDFLLCRAAFKNFTQPVRALQEMHRVLRKGGRALIIDLRRDAPPKSINQAVDGFGLGVTNSIITKLTFRFMLLKRAYTKREFEQLLAQTQFSHIDIQEDLIGLELSLDK
jgi:ubiquinone/menaquinone biosynthesis C-methylase UbiE